MVNFQISVLQKIYKVCYFLREVNAHTLQPIVNLIKNNIEH